MAKREAMYATHIERQHGSGISVADYCKSVGINARLFYYYRKKLKGKGKSNGGFVEVPLHGQASVKIEFKGAIITAPANDLKQVLSAISEMEG